MTKSAICTILPKLAGGALPLVLAACAHQSPELVQPVGETHTTSSSTGGAQPQGTDEPRSPIVMLVAKDVRVACDLPDEPREGPRFDFESARLRPRGEDILTRVAACVATRKLGDASLEIIGYTDPRGSEEYNEQLGMYRAIAARKHLTDLGVPRDRLIVTSKGEAGAKGTDEASWALDRRVEIRISGSGGTEPAKGDR